MLLSAMALTPAEMKEAITKEGGSDLLFLMDEAEVPLTVQHNIIVALGYKSTRLFSGIEENRAGVRTACTSVFGKSGESAPARGIAAPERRILGSEAWESHSGDSVVSDGFDRL